MDEHIIPAVIESMTKIYIAQLGWTIRVWREESNILENYENGDLEKAVDNYCPYYYKIIDLAQIILDMVRVNAVEVTDIFGNGIVLYREWP